MGAKIIKYLGNPKQKASASLAKANNLERNELFRIFAPENIDNMSQKVIHKVYQDDGIIVQANGWIDISEEYSIEYVK